MRVVFINAFMGGTFWSRSDSRADVISTVEGVGLSALVLSLLTGIVILHVVRFGIFIGEVNRRRISGGICEEGYGGSEFSLGVRSIGSGGRGEVGRALTGDVNGCIGGGYLKGSLTVLWSLSTFIKLSNCLFIAGFFWDMSSASLMVNRNLSLALAMILVLLVRCSLLGFISCEVLK